MREIHLLQALVLAVSLALAGCSGKSETELLGSAKGYLQKNDPQAAIIQLKNALQQQPSSGEARFLLGQALLTSGDAAGAEVELRRALELKYDATQVTPLLAQSMLRQGAFDKLTKQFGDADLSDKAAMVALQLALADAYRAQGAPDKARAALGKALALAPQSLPTLLALAQLKAAAEEYDSALAATDELLAKYPDSVDAWRLKGDLLARAKADTAGAIAAYEQAVKLQPAQAQLHAALISLYFANKDVSGADRQFTAMKAAAPDDPLTKFYEAQLLFAHEDFKQAQQALQALLRQTPENVAVLNLAGATELKLGSLGSAETYLSKAVLLQPNFVSARRLLARVQLRANQPAQALATLRPLLDKADAETLLIAGQAALLSGDAKAADGYFVRAKAGDGDNAKVRAVWAMSQLAKGHADAAFGELQTLADTDRSTTGDLALISAHLSRGEIDAALKAIDGLERKLPDSALAADLRGRAYMQQRNATAARKNFEEALRRDPRYLPAVISLAALDVVQKKPDAAKARFDDFLKLEPKSVAALLGLADLKRLGGGTPQEVAALVTRAIDADANDAQPRLALIRLYQSAGDAPAALSAAQAAAAALPNDTDIQLALARALMDSGDINQANSLFGRIASQHPDLPQGHLGLAETALAKKNFTAAWRSAKRALELAPNSIAAQRLVIIAAMSDKRAQDALPVAKAMQSQRPKESLGYILEGEIELAQQRPDAAAAAFRKALSANNPAQAPGRLHATLLQQRKDAEAVKFADSWQQTHPKDALFLFYLGDSAAARGQFDAAEKHYRQLLQLQPDNAIALNNLANALLSAHKAGALALAEKADKLAPGQPAIMDTLATALAADKQFPKAIELQKQAIAKAPNAPSFQLTMAKIYLQSGDKAQARNVLETLLKPGKDFPQRSEAETLLKSVASS